MPWAWISLLINQTWVLNIHTDMKFRTQQITQKQFFYPWNRTLVVCPISVLSSSCLTTTGDPTTDKSHRLPSLDIFPERTSLEGNISPRRGEDVDRLLQPPLLGLHLQTDR